ncbi:hypothetical protein DCS_05346 [Drechmeria coniospora]|uniref:Uncharacterized protein n=1 Tax=Drechmeria coniospora TaxID=98403 RepID=A0A151GMK1_DRECN|nr:hypothetical protein DCS_05346 [Drechmeria coniospora]KYK58333.1 hypothetical protein DCS_05346 [Drechmeria coniospora]
MVPKLRFYVHPRQTAPRHYASTQVTVPAHVTVRDLSRSRKLLPSPEIKCSQRGSPVGDQACWLFCCGHHRLPLAAWHVWPGRKRRLFQRAAAPPRRPQIIAPSHPDNVCPSSTDRPAIIFVRHRPSVPRPRARHRAPPRDRPVASDTRTPCPGRPAPVPPDRRLGRPRASRDGPPAHATDEAHASRRISASRRAAVDESVGASRHRALLPGVRRGAVGIASTSFSPSPSLRPSVKI